MSMSESAMPSVPSGISGTPNRLGRRQAVTDLKAAAAASPSHSVHLSPRGFVSPQRQATLRGKATPKVTPIASKIPSSATRRLSASVNTLNSAKTHRTIKRSVKMAVPATPSNAAAMQKENISMEDSPLHFRATASRRTTLKKSSKNSIKIKELRLVTKIEQVRQDTKKDILPNSCILTPKTSNGRSKLRPKSANLKTTKTATPLKGIFEPIATIKQTTSGLNIHNLAASTSSSRTSSGTESDSSLPCVTDNSECTVPPLTNLMEGVLPVEVNCTSTPTCTIIGPPSPSGKGNDPKLPEHSFNLKMLETFSKSESLVGHGELVPTVGKDCTNTDSIELEDMASFHAAGQMLMTPSSKLQEQALKPELGTPLSIPTVVLPAIAEAEDIDETNMEANETTSNSSVLELPRVNMSLASSHSTATCSSYTRSICPSTPTKSKSSLATTPVSKLLPKTSPSTPSSSPGSALAFYHLLLPFHSQTGKPLDPQQERTQLELWRLRASAAGVSDAGSVSVLGAIKGKSDVTAPSGKGSSVLERARAYGQTLWSSPQIRQRAEKAKRREEAEEKEKELEWVSKKLKLQQKNSTVESPTRQMGMAQRFWSAKMMDSSFVFKE